MLNIVNRRYKKFRVSFRKDLIPLKGAHDIVVNASALFVERNAHGSGDGGIEVLLAVQILETLPDRTMHAVTFASRHVSGIRYDKRVDMDVCIVAIRDRRVMAVDRIIRVHRVVLAGFGAEGGVTAEGRENLSGDDVKESSSQNTAFFAAGQKQIDGHERSDLQGLLSVGEAAG